MSLIADLHSSRARILAAFAAAAGKEARSYAPGKWTVAELLHHLVDAETVLLDRCRRTIAEETPLQMGFDENAWASRLDYRSRSLAIAAALFAATRDAVIELAERHAERDAGRCYIHHQAGRRSLGEELTKIVAHGVHHLDQIERALRAAA